MRVNAPSGILSPAFDGHGKLLIIGPRRVSVQFPQLSAPRGLILGTFFKPNERLLGIRGVS